MFLLFADTFLLLFSAVCLALERGNSRVDFLFSAACQRLPKRKEIKNTTRQRRISRPLLLLCVLPRIFYSCFVILISRRRRCRDDAGRRCVWVCTGLLCLTTYCCFSSLFFLADAAVLVAHASLCILVFLPLSELSAFSHFLPHVSPTRM